MGGPDRLCQTRLIPRSPDGDNKYPIRVECLRQKRDTGKRQNVLARNASWPDNPRSAARRAAQDLVKINT